MKNLQYMRLIVFIGIDIAMEERLKQQQEQ